MSKDSNFSKEYINDVKEQEENLEMVLNYWLLENMKVMEELTVKEPVSWSEQDCGS